MNIFDREELDLYYIPKEAHSVTQPLIADDVISEQKLTPQVRGWIHQLEVRILQLEKQLLVNNNNRGK